MDTEEVRATGDAIVKASGDPAVARTGLDVHLVPDEVRVELHPREAEPKPLRSLWHQVQRKPGALVSLWSRDDRIRVVRLTVQSETPGWNPRWARWIFAVRQTPDIQGGDAVAAQDVLSENATVLNLLLLPGEQRTVTLEFLAALDGETQPGNYDFDVVVTDIATNEVETTPGLLRLRHPTATLLHYMPALFSQPIADSRFQFEDRAFFERFLRGFEDAMEPTQAMMSSLDQYFDPDTTPAEFLPWLATWVSLVLDENWPELKRRRLIKEAVELFQWRGTRRGLTRYLEIYTGVIPEINDQPFAGMRLGRSTLLGRETLLGDVPPHTFVITLAVPDRKKVNEQTVRSIIESEKPAHTAYEVRIVERALGE